MGGLPLPTSCLPASLRKRFEVDLIARKRQACALGAAELPQHEALIGKLGADGLFIDNSTHFKHEDMNVQKLEERLLNSLQREYFKKNGEIKIDNDLLADELTRPADLAFEQSDAFQTSERNAIVSDRMNSFKKRYYRIDIVVGKITLRRYAGFFLPEEQKMVDLKHLCKIYDRRVSLALIPFYQDRIEHLRATLETRQREAPATNNKDRKFLENVLKNLESDRAAETDQVSKMAQ